MFNCRTFGRVVVLVVSMALAACGSTVAQRDGTRRGGSDVGLGPTPAGAAQAPVDAAASAPSPSAATRTDAGRSTNLGPGAIVPGAAGRLPKGVTATELRIGISYVPGGSNPTADALGVGGSTEGDVKSQYDALVKDVNDRGGVNGRKLVVRYHAVPAQHAQSSTADQLAQEECTYFTQDQPVFAVFSGSTDNSRACLSKGGVSVIDNQNITRSNADTFSRYPAYVEPITINRDRSAKPWVDALITGGYFGGWDSASGSSAPTPPKVALISFEGEQQTAVVRSLLPALKAAGHAPVDAVYATPPMSNNDIPQTLADISNAVLKFRTEGVTHVLLDDYGATYSVFFTKQAESQRYFPRYAMTSQSAPQVFMSSGEISAQSMRGAVGLGQWPILDLRDGDNAVDGPYSNPARRQCEAFLRSRNVSWADANAHLVSMSTCDQIALVVAVARALGPSVDVSRVGEAIAAIGRIDLAANAGTLIDGRHHDGSAVGHVFAFDDACSCMRYRGGPLAMP